MAKVHVVVDNRVRVDREPVRGEVLEALRAEFTYQNPQYPDKPGEPELIATWLEDEPAFEISFPRGGYRRVLNTLKLAGYEVATHDRRCSGDASLLSDARSIPAINYEPWGFQEEAVAAFIRTQNCIVRGGTGCGKTQLAIAAISKIGLPALVCVNTGGLYRQWVERIVACLGIDEGAVGQIGDGVLFLGSITVAMQQTLCKYVADCPEWFEAFGVVVVDEVQGAAADTLYAIVDALPAKYRLGISAHEKRQDRKEFLTYDLFGGVAYEIPADAVVAAGKTVDVEVRIVPTQFDGSWYRVAAASGNRFRAQAAYNRLLNQMVEDRRRNDLALEILRAEVKAGNQALVVSQRKEHCRVIDSALTGEGIRTGAMLGGVKMRRQFDATVEGIRNGSVRVAVGTLQAVGTGIDLPSVAVGMSLTSISGNESQFRQFRGRVCRAAPGKQGARLYLLHDAYQGRRAIENVLRWNGGNVVVRQPNGTWLDARRHLDNVKAANRFAVGA